MAKAAKEPGPDDVMPVSGLRSILKLVKNEEGKEVGCAVCLTADSKNAVILVDKIIKPKGVRKLLVKEAKKAKLGLDEASLRFGTASLDPADETVLLVSVNKPPAGATLYKEVKARVKPAGFRDVVFTVDEALDAEPGEGEAAAIPAATAPPPAPPPGQAPTQPDQPLKALAAKLARLIPQIPGTAGPPAFMEELKALAVEVNAHIKAGDARGAADAVDTLEIRLRQGPPIAAPGAASRSTAPASLATMQKSRLIWDLTRKKILAEVDAVKAGIASTVTSAEHAADVARALAELDEIPAALDDRLADALDAALSETEPTRHAALVTEARAVLGAYSAFVSSNPLLPALTGATPFGVTLTIGATAVSTLAALQASLK